VNGLTKAERGMALIQAQEAGGACAAALANDASTEVSKKSDWQVTMPSTRAGPTRATNSENVWRFTCFARRQSPRRTGFLFGNVGPEAWLMAG